VTVFSSGNSRLYKNKHAILDVINDVIENCLNEK